MKRQDQGPVCDRPMVDRTRQSDQSGEEREEQQPENRDENAARSPGPAHEEMGGEAKVGAKSRERTPVR